MKKLLLLILLLSFGFVLSAQADSIPSISKWYKCLDKLEKQKIGNKEELCSDKYAKKISESNNYSFTARLQRQAFPSDNYEGYIWAGDIKLRFSNLSDDIVITKILFNGDFTCKDSVDSVGCNTTFNDDYYVFVEPQTNVRRSILMVDFEVTDEMVEAHEYSTMNLSAYGFKIDY